MRIAVLRREKCQPKKCSQECLKYCPMVRTGKETITFDDGGKPIISEELCEGCGICIKKCPFGAISIVGLPEELKGSEIHRYGKNGFVLYGLPIPKEGRVVGILGQNGIGKSTAVKILSGVLKPNLGRGDEEASWDEIVKSFAGSELQAYFEKLRDGGIKTAYKPQYVDAIPKVFEGKVRTLLERTDETGMLDDVVKMLELENTLNNDIRNVSGGELQRVAVAACILRDADFYFLDEITPYLDIYQRVNVSKVIKEFLAERRKAVVVVEHDLAILDMLADVIHIVYGKPGTYGVFTQPKSVRVGINEYLRGYLPQENVRIRDKPIEFEVRPPKERRERRAVLTFKAFTKSYDGRFSLHAYGGEFEHGEVVGIVGRNAIGKSTFIKVLAGVLKPDGDELPLEEGVKVSYKPQYLRGDLETTVHDLLSSIKPLDAAEIHEIIEPLGISELFELKVCELSGGELQSVAIAACLLQDADIYMLDEPSAHLDVEQRVRATKVLRRFAEKKEAVMLVVDHDIYMIDLLSDRLLVFTGVPGVRGEARGPFEMREGMNLFLKDLGITFRRDEASKRPRVNKLGSRLDKEQKERGEYYYASSEFQASL